MNAQYKTTWARTTWTDGQPDDNIDPVPPEAVDGRAWAMCGSALDPAPSTPGQLDITIFFWFWRLDKRYG